MGPLISGKSRLVKHYNNLARLILLRPVFFGVRRFRVRFHGNEAGYFLAEWHWGGALRFPGSVSELGHGCVVIVLVKKMDSAS